MSDALLIGALVITLILLLFWLNYQSRSKLSALRQQFAILQQHNAEQQHVLSEHIMRLDDKLSALSVEFSEKISEIQTLPQQVQTVQRELQQLQQEHALEREQQPQDKLYSRALKLAALGADVEELMQECELPRAEAELLLAIHHKQN